MLAFCLSKPLFKFKTIKFSVLTALFDYNNLANQWNITKDAEPQEILLNEQKKYKEGYCRFFQEFISQLGNAELSEPPKSLDKVMEVWNKSEFWNCQINSRILSQQVSARINYIDITKCTLSQQPGQSAEAAWEKIICQLSQNKKIKRIKLEDCSLGDSMVDFICTHMSYLTELDLRANLITNRGAIAMANSLKNLRVLYLRRNLIGNQGAQAIVKNLTQLRQLYLGGNLIGDEGAVSISEHSKYLTVLYLWNNKITNYGAISICSNLTTLRELWLNQNIITETAKIQIRHLLPPAVWLDV